VPSGKSPTEDGGWGNVDAGGGKRRAMTGKARARVPASRPKGIKKNVDAARPKPLVHLVVVKPGADA
jgi:hypothetical protein